MTTTTITFKNSSDTSRCALFWIPGKDFADRNPRLYHVLEPGEVYRQPTYVSHVWEVKTEKKDLLLRSVGHLEDPIRIVPRSPCLYDGSKTHISFCSSEEFPNPYSLFWVKHVGKHGEKEKICGKIEHDRPIRLSSYVGHLFRVRNAQGRLLMECTASSKSQTYDIAEISPDGAISCKNSKVGVIDGSVTASRSISDTTEKKKIDSTDSSGSVLLLCKTVYDRKCIEGFMIMLEPGLVAKHKALLPELSDDLKEIVRLLPSQSIDLLRGTRIYFNERLCFGDTCKPTIGRGMCHHPSSRWLENHGNQSVKAGCIECYQALHYLQWRAQQPAMLLHELSHHLHFCLGIAADRIILNAFAKAKASGKYEKVGYCGSASKLKRHYALTNHHEYFAECSEAYWSSARFRNDYEPYTRAELEEFDPFGFKMCEAVWGLAGKIKPERCATPLRC